MSAATKQGCAEPRRTRECSSCLEAAREGAWTLLAFLDGAIVVELQPWRLALAASPRTFQAGASSACEGRPTVQSFGPGRARRWMTPPRVGFRQLSIPRPPARLTRTTMNLTRREH